MYISILVGSTIRYEDESRSLRRGGGWQHTELGHSLIYSLNARMKQL